MTTPKKSATKPPVAAKPAANATPDLLPHHKACRDADPDYLEQTRQRS